MRDPIGIAFDVIISAIVIAGIMIMLYGFSAESGRPHVDTTPCHPTTHPTHPAGRVRCWSGGVLVYDEPAYRNGGYRCTAGGAEIVTRGELCVEEWTGSADDPPGETER